MDLGPVIETLRGERDTASLEITRLQEIIEGIDGAIESLNRLVPVAPKTADKESELEGAPAEEPKRTWPEDDDELRRLWAEGVPTKLIASTLNRSAGTVYQRVYALELPKRPRVKKDATRPPSTGHSAAKRRALRKDVKPKRRFGEHFKADPENVNGLDPAHAALAEARTIFPKSVVDPKDSPQLLVSGANQRKIGDRVVKGPWSGMPIYCLTLEERATCPKTCHHWSTCYGNGMPRGRRHRHGPELQFGLTTELIALAGKYPKGFVVRLHVLGDFYSTEYVRAWGDWLEMLPALHVYGYTARKPESEIGYVLEKLNKTYSDRFAIRWSDPDPGPMRAVTIWRKPEASVVPEGIVCPAQTDATDCCGTCGLCWSPAARNKSIAFIAHGSLGRSATPAPVEENLKGREPWPSETRNRDDEDIHKPVDVPVAADRPFAEPLDRRCARCQQIFKAIRASETLCSLCTGGAKQRGQSAADWARA